MNNTAVADFITDVDANSFDSLVIERSKTVPVLVDFWATWCGPCAMLTPELESQARQRNGDFVLAKVDIDRNPSVATVFGVESIPTVIAFHHGKVVDRFTGLLPKSKISTFIDHVCPSAAERLEKKAQEVQLSDAAAAENLLREAIKLEPKRTTALAALANLCLREGRMDEARELLKSVHEGDEGWRQASSVRKRIEWHERLASNGGLDACKERAASQPQDRDAQLNLGLALAAIGQFDEALETLILIVESDREYGSRLVRPELVHMFEILGNDSELVNQYRPRLARALY